MPSAKQVTEVRPADAELRREIEAVEAERIRALVEVDLDALADLYHEALVHIHAPGVRHTKAMLLEHTRTRQAYREIQRGELTITQLAEDVVAVTGSIRNRLGNPDGSERVVDGIVTQVLHRDDDGRWRFVSFQLTPFGEKVWGDLPSEQQERNK